MLAVVCQYVVLTGVVCSAPMREAEAAALAQDLRQQNKSEVEIVKQNSPKWIEALVNGPKK
ncbi:MAG: hypothetical protein AAGC69_09920 [Paracraurococcus sp.]|jgi:hypothetical protein